VSSPARWIPKLHSYEAVAFGRAASVLRGEEGRKKVALSKYGENEGPEAACISRGISERCMKLRGGGLLVVGTPLPFEKSLEVLGYVREHGVLQFIHMYNANKDRSNEKLLWGEELEYPILKMDRAQRKVRLSLRATEVLETLREREHKSGRSDNRKEACAWHPEYGSWMVEGTPRLPFGGFVRDLRRVEPSLRLRRRRLLASLDKDEIVPTVTSFPLMGTTDFTSPPTTPEGPVACSSTCSDDLINPHPRFSTLTANIRKRRGSKVHIKVPLYMDEKTEERLTREEEAGIITDGGEVLLMSGLERECKKRETIEMDCMAFGMGMSCLQVTFQTRDVAESRHLYDQLAVLTPIMLALSAATPVLKGRLADTDVRWATIAASVDDRTPQERGRSVCSPSHKGQLHWMAGGGERPLGKSRYESISSYICNCKKGTDPKSSLDKYNDIACPIDEPAYHTLLASGIDARLARHVAHLFVRDPLVIFSEKIHIPDTSSSDHFENIQSTNWQTVRWKPPPKDSLAGWRVEFRSMEAQLTDFDNAAFTVLTVLISRVLLAFKLNLYVPLSKVDANMQEAHKRDAVTEGKFWFRKHMATPDTDQLEEGEDGDECEAMSVYEILTGKGTHFPGLLPLVFAYLDHVGCDSTTRDTIRQYAMVLEKRAKGELMTAAKWMRTFIHAHPEYAGDSVVSDGVAFDLMQACADIGEGRREAPELLGKVKIEPITPESAYEVPLDAAPFDEEERRRLISRYACRAIMSKEQGTAISDGWKTPIAEQMELLEKKGDAARKQPSLPNEDGPNTFPCDTSRHGRVMRVSLDSTQQQQQAKAHVDRCGSRGVNWCEDSSEEVSHIVSEGVDTTFS